MLVEILFDHRAHRVPGPAMYEQSGEQTALAAVTVPGRGRRPKVGPQGRVCAEEGCTTRLSIYNRSERCFAHQVGSPAG